VLSLSESRPTDGFIAAHALPTNNVITGIQQRVLKLAHDRVALQFLATKRAGPARKHAFPQAHIEEWISGRLQCFDSTVADILRNALCGPVLGDVVALPSHQPREVGPDRADREYRFVQVLDVFIGNRVFIAGVRKDRAQVFRLALDG